MNIKSSEILNNTLKTNLVKAKAGVSNVAASTINNTEPSKVAMHGLGSAAAYNKAGLNIKQQKDELVNSLKSILKKNSLIDSDEQIHRVLPYSSENAIRMKIGEERKDFKGFFNENKHACAYFTPEGKPDKIFIQNEKTGEISFYDCLKGELKNYSKKDVEALKYYKYHPDSIHAKLRHNKDIYSGSFKTEMENVIDDLSQLFPDKTKVSKTNKDITLYRALEKGLSEDDIQKLTTIGGIFTEKSFCSTTKNLNTARIFQSDNPILKIDFPKDSEYIDIEKIFNIDREHWREAEYLLDKESQFLVTGFDPKENIINVRYIARNNLK